MRELDARHPMARRAGVCVRGVRRLRAADNFRVRFNDARLTADEKLLLLAGAVFVDLLYFERKAS